MSNPAVQSELEELLKAVGDDLIRAYREKYFPARIIQACPTIYSIENASKWVKFDKFCAFVAQALQEQSPPPTGSSVHDTELSQKPVDPPRKRSRVESPSSDGTRGFSAHPIAKRTAEASSSLSGDAFDSGESDNDATKSIPHKRKRGEQKPRTSRPTTKMAAGMVRVTRQCWASRVETITEPPENWRIPESGRSAAHILDLTGDQHEYKDAKGKLLAMSAIIKHKCTDGWTGGSGGSLSKATTVPLLGEDVKCQKMSHQCRGSFVCSLAAPDLWSDYKRYDLDLEPSSPPGDQQQGDLGEQDGHSHIRKALVFYNNVVKEKCQFDSAHCPGRPVLKMSQQISIEGKFYFVGCSASTTGDAENSHFSRQIPGHVDEEVLQQLFTTGRVNFSNTIVPDGPCTFQVPPRTGLKQKQCPHVHLRDGKIVEGFIVHRPCPAKITMFSPIDHTLRKAVVMPAAGVPHNHPSHPSDKLTRRAKAALRAAGIMDTRGSTVDRGPTPSVDGDCSTPHMTGAGPSHPPLTSDSSISTALMAPTYHIENFY